LSAEGGSDFRKLLEQDLKPLVIALPYKIITMEKMNELAARPLQAGIEIPDIAHIPWLPMECHASSSKSIDHCFRVIVGRVIIDYLDLHDVRTGVLSQHARQCLFQITGTIVSGNHDGP